MGNHGLVSARKSCDGRSCVEIVRLEKLVGSHRLEDGRSAHGDGGLR
jgi:hypothetical protein